MATTTSTSPAPVTAAVAADGAGPAKSRASQIRALRERARSFAKDVRSFVRKTPRTIASLGDCRQLVRASGFIGAYYINAGEAPSKEDFLFGIRGCRREAKQSAHWLNLLDSNLEEKSEGMRRDLLKEASELERIFSAILQKVRMKGAKADTE